jgi:predicted hotdog family 3-hydroxylacyl-ACP dehydratase
MGASIGRWEGATLVADTLGFNDKTTLDREGYPHSDAMHLVEHIRRVDHDNLVDLLTVEDPKAYTKPWSATLNFRLRPDWRIMEHVCEDNASFVDFNKKATQTPKKK